MVVDEMQKIKKSPRRQRRKKSILKKKMTNSKNLSESEGEIEKTPSSKRYYAKSVRGKSLLVS